MSESRLHTDDYQANGAADGEAADVTDETSGFADEGAGDEAAQDEVAPAPGDGTAEGEGPAEGDGPAEESDALAEFTRELRMMPGDWYVVHSYAVYENRVKTNRKAGPCRSTWRITSSRSRSPPTR